MVSNAIFNNISAISWQEALLVDKTGVPGDNHRPAANQCQTLSHYVVHLTLSGIQTHNISGDLSKSNYQLPYDQYVNALSTKQIYM